MPTDHDLDPALGRRWAEAERRLYPIAAVDDQRYVQLVGVVRAATDLLADHHSPAALSQAWQAAADVVARAADRVGVEPAPAEVDLIAGAAFALRHREITAAAAQAAAHERIAAATAAGQTWVVLVDHGVPGAHHRIELHLPDGPGLHAYREPAVDSDRTVYGVDIIDVDPGTGTLVDGPPRSQAVYDSPEAWQDGIRKARARIEAGEATTP